MSSNGMVGSANFFHLPSFESFPTLPFSSSSSCAALVVYRREVARRKLSTMASLYPESPQNGGDSLPRRAFLLVGLSALPLLQLRAVSAVEVKGIPLPGEQLKEACCYPVTWNHNIITSPRTRARARARQFSSERKSDQGSQVKQDSKMTEAGPQMQDEQEVKTTGTEGPPVPDELSYLEQNQTFSHDKQDAKVTETETPWVPYNLSYLGQNQTEQVNVHQGLGNQFVSFLNELGVIGSGVLGALYAVAQRDKVDLKTTIDSMNATLSEKEDVTASLEKNLERGLLNEQEEHRKKVKKLKEDEASLSNKLASAKGTVAVLGHELQLENRIVKELSFQIDQLNIRIAQANEDRRMLEANLKEKMDSIEALHDRVSLLSLMITEKEKYIEKLMVSFAGKESEWKNLNAIIDGTKADTEEANSSIQHLNIELLKAREELDLKTPSIDDLNMKIESLAAERDIANKKCDILQKDYNDLKSTSTKRAASDSELLTKKDHELQQQEEKLYPALTEARSSQELIAKLNKEKDSIQAMLEEETNNLKNLRKELQITQDSLGVSKLQASDLSEQLQVSKSLTEELISEVSRIQAESSEAHKLLIKSFNDAKSTSELLSKELTVVKKAVKKTKEELAVASDELKAGVQSCESLRKELLEIYEKADTTEHQLKEERKMVANMNRELEASGKLVQKQLDARKILESYLDEATKSLIEVNKWALSLSRALENANARAAILEADKEALHKSINGQNDVKKRV